MATITTELIEQKRDERGRKITSQEEREALLEAYGKSGLTQKAFARREGVKFCTFTSWLQQRRGAAGPGRQLKSVRFAEVSIPQRAVSTSAVEVQLPDGTLIRGTSAAEIVEVVRVLRSERGC